MSDSPHDPTDVRDEQLAARLETEPLDEVTRARLVRTAMAASAVPAPSSRWTKRSQWVGAAALVVLLVVVLFGVVARQQTSDKFNDAGSRLSSNDGGSSSDERSTQLALPASGSTFSELLGIGSLGDLGDVGTIGKLRSAVTGALPAAEAKVEAQRPVSTLDFSDSALSIERRLIEDACTADARPPAGRTIALGTGTVDGKPVSVEVVEKSNGTRIAYTADADGCVVGERVKL